MDRIEREPDIAVPNKDIDCRDNELGHPRRIDDHFAGYGALLGRTVADMADLVGGFYRWNADAAYAGFKTMPNRLPDFDRFVSWPNIRFVTLVRNDVEATVASHAVAASLKMWRRPPGPLPVQWQFLPEQSETERGLLRFVLGCRRMIERIPGAIGLRYEDLCVPGYANAELDAFFGRQVGLDDRRPPVAGSDYVRNWDEFAAFIKRERAALRGAA